MRRQAWLQPCKRRPPRQLPPHWLSRPSHRRRRPRPNRHRHRHRHASEFCRELRPGSMWRRHTPQPAPRPPWHLPLCRRRFKRHLEYSHSSTFNVATSHTQPATSSTTSRSPPTVPPPPPPVPPPPPPPPPALAAPPRLNTMPLSTALQPAATSSCHRPPHVAPPPPAAPAAPLPYQGARAAAFLKEGTNVGTKYQPLFFGSLSVHCYYMVDPNNVLDDHRHAHYKGNTSSLISIEDGF